MIYYKKELVFQLTLEMEGFLINSYCEGAVVLIIYTNHSSLWNKEQKNPDKETVTSAAVYHYMTGIQNSWVI